jgi:hypothetical protein
MLSSARAAEFDPAVVAALRTLHGAGHDHLERTNL